ncbi:MAG: DegT/DnrJ/EryC1/StrS family aminotransferase [Bacteroidia bacterium]|nr:DegT/DnrJ/EryC1/StrS family aminotransferase [Bacteroidia bacterium]
MSVPFADLRAQYLSIKEEMDAAIADVIDNTAFIRTPIITEFEHGFAEMMSAKHCIGVANGTDAIYIVLKMLGIGQGDEVITVANSWISSSEVITQAGAKPVFADIEPGYFTIDPADIERKITPATKAIIPVHLTGHPAQIDQIMEIAERHGLFVIEDCAQSHFATLNGQLAGTFGVASTFSFYPGKNLGAYGDAGGILTNDDALAEKCRMYANHGALIKHQHHMEGINSRLDGLQAAVLKVKLGHILKWTEQRQFWAKAYATALEGIEEIELPAVRPGAEHVYHLYMIRAQDRDGLQTFLDARGIQTVIHYPTPLPFLPAYSYLGHSREDFPVAAAYQDAILSLPFFPEMNQEMIDYVAESIRTYYR